MADQDGLYKGREQSQIKHLVLKQYLTAMAFKVAQSRRDRLTAINYVDGFSGPWETQDEAGYEDTSFRQAINVLREVRDELAKSRGALTVRFVFCEKDPARYQKLSAAVAGDTDLEIHCIPGRFEERLGDISKVLPDGFTFTFIDPTGFKLGTGEIGKFLKTHGGEFLWNYMADHANRFLTRDGLDDAFRSLLAEQEWTRRINDPALAHLKNEEKVLVVLRERLKELDCANYILDFPVLRPRQDRVQFRLLFGTRHAAGVSVFRDAQKKAEKVQAVKREGLKQESDGPSLISPAMHATSFLDAEGVDGSLAKSAAKVSIASHLAKAGPRAFSDLVAPILETERLTETGLKDVLVDMKKCGQIHFDLPPRKRKPQDDTLIRLP